MDQIFDRCEKWLKNATTTNGISLEKLYDDCDSTKDDKRRVVIDRLLNEILEIQQVALQNPLPNGMIAIALQDMKTFNMMINVLVIEGIYPCLTPGINIPLALRSKSQMATPKQEPDKYRDLLERIVNTLVQMLNTKGDVRDIMLRGTFTADFLCAAIEYGFNCETKKPDVYNQLKSQIQTFDLFQYFTTLLRPSCPDWFKAVVSRQLALLPITRPNGVRALIEFVSGLRTHDQVSLTELEKVVRVLKSVPRGVEEDEYAKKVGTQLVQILGSTFAVNSPGDVLKSATLHVVNGLYEQKPSMVKNGLQQVIILRLTEPHTEHELSEALSALATLVINPSSDLITALRKRLIVPLWSLLCYYYQSKRAQTQIKGLFVALLQTGNDEDLDAVVKAMLIKGVGEYSFGAGEDGGVKICATEPDSSVGNTLEVFEVIDERIELFVPLLQNVEEDVVSGLFVRVIRRWLTGSKSDEDMWTAFVDAKVLERLATEYKDKLVKSPMEIIQVVSSVLTEYTVNREDNRRPQQDSLVLDTADSDDEDSDDEDGDDDENGSEMVSLCLSLVAGLAPELAPGKEHDMLISLKPQIQYICDSGPTELSTKASTALEFLRMVSNDHDNVASQDDSRTTLRKALSSLDDPMVPIRAHGLHQLKQLITNKDPVIDVDTALRVLLAQLTDNDSFIYLNSIKALETLSDVYGPQIVVPSLLGYYTNFKRNTDERLRAGEVVLRIVERLGAAFSGQVASSIASTLINMVSARNSENDQRLRNSALSILGAICEVNPQGLTSTQLIDSIDCAIGVLTFEKSSVMRSAAVVLIGSLVSGVKSLNDIPKEYVKQIMTRLRACQQDEDALVRVQANATLDRIGTRLTSM